METKNEEEKMRTIDFILENDIKNSELKVLKFIDDNKKIKISRMKEVVNWYQAVNIIPKLKELGLIIEEKETIPKTRKDLKDKKIEWIKINYDNEVIKILFGEIK